MNILFLRPPQMRNLFWKDFLVFRRYLRVGFCFSRTFLIFREKSRFMTREVCWFRERERKRGRREDVPKSIWEVFLAAIYVFKVKKPREAGDWNKKVL